MKIRIWGARGSIPAPLKPDQVEEKIVRAIIGMSPQISISDEAAVRSYVHSLPPLTRGTAGGNTACVEIQGAEAPIIIDAGSGIRDLGLELMKGPCGRGQGTIHLLISHPHWDHIQGFPFFVPAFIPGNRIFIYSIHKLHEALEDQQTSVNFPVPLSYMQATIEFKKLKLGEPFMIGNTRINTLRNAHPGISYSFRLEDQQSVFVYASDAEYKQTAPDHNPEQIISFFSHADALIFDAQYTYKEIEHKADWGHSSAMIGVDMARAAGVRKLILFHHDPTYSDIQLQDLQAQALAYQAENMAQLGCEVIVAYEGLTLDLSLKDPFDPRGTADLTLLSSGNVFAHNGIIDLSKFETLTTAALQRLIEMRRESKDVPIILAGASPSVQQIIRLAGYLDSFAMYPSVEAAQAAAQARAALKLPGHIIKGRYQIEEKLVDGQLGVVLKATDTQVARSVALKILAPTFSAETIDRFARYVPQITSLNHPNVVRFFALDREGDVAFIVEELAGGLTLRDLLNQRGANLPPSQIIEIALDITLALEHIHGRSVLHGNLKPNNIFLTAVGARLSDISLGRLEEGRNLLDTPLLLLAPAYLAPEQILGQLLDARTDLYALGAVIYHLLAGRPPFTGGDHEILLAHVRETPRPLRELNPAVSPALEHLVLKLLAKNPNDRYASAQQVHQILNSLALNDGEAQHPRHSSKIVGRDTQIQELAELWAATSQGHGQLAFVVGEPGIGKTRLVKQVAAESGAAVVLIGQCRELEMRVAYLPFREALQTYFTAVSPELFDEEASPLLAILAQIVPAIRKALPDLAAPPALDPRQEQLRLVASLAHLIRLATQRRPWLLVLDDLQWADELSLDLLRYLSRYLPSTALMIVGTYRDTEIEAGHALRQTLRDLERYPGYRQFVLERLSQAEVLQILSSLWRQPVPENLAARIYQRTEGNPFYVEELARGIVDAGLVRPYEDAQLPVKLAEVNLPQSMRDAVWNRIRRLSPDTQTLLRQAAVLGPIFRLADLRAMSDMSEWEMLEHLDMALERGLVVETAEKTVLRFSHTEIHYVLYADLSTPRQRLLHRQAGEILERRAQPAPEYIAGELAHHFTEAGDYTRAAVYNFQAGKGAEGAYANETALRWYERSLAALDHVESIGADQARALRLSCYEGMGRVLQMLGRWDSAHDLYHQALTLAEDAGDLLAAARVQVAAGELFRKQSRYAEAAIWLERALACFERLGDQVGVARALHQGGILAMQQGDHAMARTRYEQSLVIWREMGDHPHVASVLNHLGILSQLEDNLVLAYQRMEESLVIRRELGDKAAIANSLINLADTAYHQGRYADSRAFCEESLSLQYEVGDRGGIAASLHNLGNAARAQGDYPTAHRVYSESMAIVRELGDGWSLAYLLEDLACLAVLEYQYDRALWLAGAAATQRESIGAPLPPMDQLRLEQALAPAYQRVADPDAAFATGRALSLEQALDQYAQIN